MALLPKTMRASQIGKQCIKYSLLQKHPLLSDIKLRLSKKCLFMIKKFGCQLIKKLEHSIIFQSHIFGQRNLKKNMYTTALNIPDIFYYFNSLQVFLLAQNLILTSKYMYNVYDMLITSRLPPPRIQKVQLIQTPSVFEPIDKYLKPSVKVLPNRIICLKHTNQDIGPISPCLFS